MGPEDETVSVVDFQRELAEIAKLTSRKDDVLDMRSKVGKDLEKVSASLTKVTATSKSPVKANSNVPPAEDISSSKPLKVEMEVAPPLCSITDEDIQSQRKQREEDEESLQQLKADILAEEERLLAEEQRLQRANASSQARRGRSSSRRCAPATARSSVASIGSLALSAFCAADSRCASPDRSTRTPSPSNTRTGSREDSQHSDPALPSVPPLPGTVAARRPSGKGKPPGPPPMGKSARASTATVAEAGPAAPRPSKGKGKGAPPPPGASPQGKGNSGSKGSMSGEGIDSTPRNTRLVNLHWRSSLEPRENQVSTAEDAFVSGMFDMLPRHLKASNRYRENLSWFEKAVGISDAFCMDSGARGSADDAETPCCSPSPSPSPSPAPASKDHDFGTPVAGIKAEPDMTPAATTPADNAAQTTPNPSSRRRTRRNTIFTDTEDCPVGMLSQRKLEEFFQVKPAAIDCRPRASIGTGPVRTLITDPNHLKIIDILVKKDSIIRHAHLRGDEREEAAVEALVAALRACDYSRAPPQALEDIRKVTAAHLEDRSRQNILQFVEKYGEDALQGLEHPHLHRLLYGALRIPAINIRLECMVTDATREESLGHCRGNLQILHTGLLTLSRLLGPLGRFFAAARQMGNSVNQDCFSASLVSGYGFKMSTIVKLLELKSPVRKDISLFHFVLMLMPSEEVAQLCEATAIEDLQRAKCARSSTVHQVCIQFLEGFRHIRKLVQTGKYKDDEIPEDQNPDGTADVFFDSMRRFTEECKPEADYVQWLCHEVFETYRSFSVYFDDVKCSYPPPTDEAPAAQGDEKKDLFEVCHWLLTSIRQARKEIVDIKLEEEWATAASRAPSPPIGATRIDQQEASVSSATTIVSQGPRAEAKADVVAVAVADAMISAKVTPDTLKLAEQAELSPRESAPPAATTEMPRRSPALRMSKEPRISNASVVVEDVPSPKGPPPNRRVVASGNSPTKMPSLLQRAASSRSALLLPGVERVGAETPQSSAQGAASSSAASVLSSEFMLSGSNSCKSGAGTACSSSTDGGDTPRTPTRKMKKCRKSLTSLASKAEQQGLMDLFSHTDGPLLSARGEASFNGGHSPHGSDDGVDSDMAQPFLNIADLQALGFADQIREGARLVRRTSRGQFAPTSPGACSSQCPAPGSPVPAASAGAEALACGVEISPRRASRRMAEYNASKYPLSPVFEFEQGSEDRNSATPARHCRREALSPIPVLPQDWTA